MVRNCITCLTAGSGINNPLVTSQPLTTTLFFLLYHLASYQAGSEALVSCGVMESLLKNRLRKFLQILYELGTLLPLCGAQKTSDPAKTSDPEKTSDPAKTSYPKKTGTK